MRKIEILLCFCIVIVTMFGCGTNSSNDRTTVNFYYKTEPVDHTSENGVITVEARSTSAAAEDYQQILEQYLNGARGDNCVSPFPAGTTLKSFSLNGSNATIMLSPHITMLSNADLSIACICIARTVFDLTDVTSVQISAQNNLLNGEQYITITDSGFVTEDYMMKIPNDES